MAALTKSKTRQYAQHPPDATADLAVDGAVVVYQGAMVGIKVADGYARGFTLGANDAGSDKFAGFALDEADNSGGSDGDKSVRVLMQGVLKRATVAGVATVAQLGFKVFAIDSDALTTAPAGGLNKCIGRVMQVHDDGTCDVAFYSELRISTT